MQQPGNSVSNTAPSLAAAAGLSQPAGRTPHSPAALATRPEQHAEPTKGELGSSMRPAGCRARQEQPGKRLPQQSQRDQGQACMPARACWAHTQRPASVHSSTRASMAAACHHQAACWLARSSRATGAAGPGASGSTPYDLPVHLHPVPVQRHTRAPRPPACAARLCGVAHAGAAAQRRGRAGAAGRAGGARSAQGAPGRLRTCCCGIRLRPGLPARAQGARQRRARARAAQKKSLDPFLDLCL